MEDIYGQNINIVKEIASLFGLKLLRCDPHWSFAKLEVEIPSIESETLKEFYTVPDDFMGKLALVLGYDWTFEDDDVQLRESIKRSKDSESSLDGNMRKSEEYTQARLKYILDIRDHLRFISTEGL